MKQHLACIARRFAATGALACVCACGGQADNDGGSSSRASSDAGSLASSASSAGGNSGNGNSGGAAGGPSTSEGSSTGGGGSGGIESRTTAGSPGFVDGEPQPADASTSTTSSPGPDTEPEPVGPGVACSAGDEPVDVPRLLFCGCTPDDKFECVAAYTSTRAPRCPADLAPGSPACDDAATALLIGCFIEDPGGSSMRCDCLSEGVWGCR